MNKPRLIMGKSVARYIVEGFFVIAFFLIIALLFLLSYLKSKNEIAEAIESHEPIIIIYTMIYGSLIGSISLIFFTIFIAKDTIFKVFEWDRINISKKIDIAFIYPFALVALLIAPLIVGGHFLTKYKISQQGYHYCGNLRLKDRFYRAFVLEKEDCHDSRLQRIMLQYDKKNHLILEEAHSYLRGQKMVQTTGE